MHTKRLRLEFLEDRLTPVTLPPGFSESLFASGLNAPTAMAADFTGRVFVTEQTGTLRVVQSNGTLLPTPFLSVSVDPSGERGLLGVALDPNFSSNGFLYVYYTVPGVSGGPAHNRVSRFTADLSGAGNVAVPGSEVPILDLDPLSLTATNHNGGAIHFGPDGKLYVAVGDNANGNNAQNLNNRLGKILRINSDGTIPADNPGTIDNLGAVPAGATRAIWAAGLRNPFTFAFDTDHGTMFINDVGQQTFEEIDAGRAGANYGWPATEGDFNQSSFPNFTRPLFDYAHNDPHPLNGSAIIGGLFRPNGFPTSMDGDYFFADLSGGWINVRDGVTGQVTNFADNPTGQAIVGFERGPGGQMLYLARSPGAIYQITFANSATGSSIAVGTGAGATAVAKLIDPTNGSTQRSFSPFGSFTGGVRVASADVTGDGIVDLVAGAGPGGGPDVRVFDGATGQQVRQFFAFESTFSGGVFVAAANLDSDGQADLVVSADEGGGPRIRVFSGKDGSEMANFLGIEDVKFRGGTRISLGDVSGDNVPDLVISAGEGGGPRIAVYDGMTLRPTIVPRRMFNDFFAFESTLRNGAFVAAGDVTGDGRGDIIAGAGPGGAPRVVVFDGMLLPTGGPNGSMAASFFGGSGGLREGIHVAAKNVDADPTLEIATAAARFSQPTVAIFKLSGGDVTITTSYSVFDNSFTGGVFVG
jgi:glucose/arabinose dehydrogenase